MVSDVSGLEAWTAILHSKWVTYVQSNMKKKIKNIQKRLLNLQNM